MTNREKARSDADEYIIWPAPYMSVGPAPIPPGVDIDQVRADMCLPVQHGTRSPSKTRCPGCGAVLNEDGTCSADPERSLPPLISSRTNDHNIHDELPPFHGIDNPHAAPPFCAPDTMFQELSARGCEIITRLERMSAEARTAAIRTTDNITPQEAYRQGMADAFGAAARLVRISLLGASVGPVGPPRIFRYADMAWRCPRSIDLCKVRLPMAPCAGDELIDVALVGYEATIAAEHFAGDLPAATLIGPWEEWFAAVLQKAAHEYFDASLQTMREYMRFDSPEEADDRPILNRSNHLDAAVKQIYHVYAFGRIAEHHFAAAEMFDETCPIGSLADYFANVKADIENRLRGEPGKVVIP